MAKSSFPAMKTGGGVLPKLVGLLVGLAVVALVVQHPVDAAHWLTGALTGLGGVVEGLASFLRALLG